MINKMTTNYHLGKCLQFTKCETLILIICLMINSTFAQKIMTSNGQALMNGNKIMVANPSPMDISSCELAIDADHVVLNGSLISQFNDQSKSLWNFKQNVSTNQATYTSNALNGHAGSNI